MKSVPVRSAPLTISTELPPPAMADAQPVWLRRPWAVGFGVFLAYSLFAGVWLAREIFVFGFFAVLIAVVMDLPVSILAKRIPRGRVSRRRRAADCKASQAIHMVRPRLARAARDARGAGRASQTGRSRKDGGRRRDGCGKDLARGRGLSRGRHGGGAPTRDGGVFCHRARNLSPPRATFGAAPI